MNPMIRAIAEMTVRQLRNGDDNRFLKKAERVQALPGTIFRRYVKQSKNVWFTTESSGEHEATAGMTHWQRVQLLDLPRLVKEPGMTPIKAARLATTEGDVKVFCSCPAYKFWGFQYINTQQRAAIQSEDRYPIIRNPALRGTVCKHLRQALTVLPFNAPKIAHELRISRPRGFRYIEDHQAEHDLCMSAYLRGMVEFREAFDAGLRAPLSQDEILAVLAVPPVHENSGPHKFSTTQLNLPEALASWVMDYGFTLRDEDVVERETDIHVTTLYGIHAESPRDVAEAVKGFGPVKVRLGELRTFSNDTDVLWIEILSDDIKRLNSLLREKLEHTQTQPNYIPHCTVAYMNKGAATQHFGIDEFEGIDIEFDSLTFVSRDGARTQIPLVE